MAETLEILLKAQNHISKELKAVQKDLAAVKKSVDNTGTSADKNTKNVDKFNKSLDGAKKSASTLRTALVALGGVALFVGAIREIAQFEQSMANVKAVLKGVTDNEFKALNEEARRLGATTVFSASEAAGGLEFLARAGFSANQAIAALEGTLNLAAAGGLGLAEAADIASNVLTGFNLSAEETGRVADVLALTAASANTNISQLGTAMAYVAPIAAAMDVPLETASAAIGKLSDAGLQGSVAGTGLRKILSTLNKPTKKLSTTMKRLGIDTKDVAVSGDNLSEVMALLGASGLTAADALDLFGERGAPAALVLAKVSDETRILNDALVAADGTAVEMANTMSDTLVGAFKQLKSAISETVLQAGDKGLLSTFRRLIDITSGVIRTLNGTQDPLDKNAVLYRQVADGVEALYTGIKVLIGLKIATFVLSSVSAITTLGIASIAAARGVVTLGVASTALGASLRAALGPIALIVSLGVALYDFATKDAPKAVDALKDSAQAVKDLRAEINAFKQDVDDIEVRIEFNEKDINDAALSLVRYKKELAGLKRDAGFFQTDEEEAEIKRIERVIAALTKKILVQSKVGDELKKELTKQTEAEKKVEEDRIKDLSKLRAEADQAELFALKAKKEALLKIDADRLAFAKKTANDEATIRKQVLKAELDAELITVGEYYAALRVLSEDQRRFDINIIDQKIKAVQEGYAQEVQLAKDAAEQKKLVSSAEEGVLIDKQLSAKLDSLRFANEAEIEEVKLGKEAIRIAIAAEDQKLQTQAIAAQKSFNEKKAKETEKGRTDRQAKAQKAFDEELDKILSEDVKRKDAIRRSSELGETPIITAAVQIEGVDEETLVKLRSLREEMEAFNLAAGDEELPVKIGAVGTAIKEVADEVDPLLQSMMEGFSTGLTNALLDFADGTKTASEAFKEFARSFLKEILKMIIQKKILNALSSSFGFSGGGEVVAGAAKGGYFKLSTGGYVKDRPPLLPGYADGGFITGKGTSTSDSIPARLSNGEYVIQAQAVDHYGLNFIEAINRMALASKSKVPKFQVTRPRRAAFATGGAVSNQSKEQAPAPQNSYKIINAIDSGSVVSEGLATLEGEEAIINIIRANSSTLKQVFQ